LHSERFTIKAKSRIAELYNPQAVFYVACIAVGVGGALAAIILKNSIGYLEQSLRDAVSSRNLNIFILALPPIGILLTVLFTNRIVKDDLSHGVTKVLAAISTKGGIVSGKMIWAPLVGCIITVGFGGSVGMEAPIMHSGSAIGSKIGRVLGLNYRQRVLMVGCGTAAAVAAIFKAPIAGALFAIEILMIDLTNQSVIPLLISSVTGAMLAKVFTGQDIEFVFAVYNHFDYRNTIFYILLGLICGLIAEYIRHIQKSIGRVFHRIPSIYTRALTGGLALVPLVLLFPPLFGEGYSGMRSMLTGHADELLANSPFFGMSSQNLIFVCYIALFILFKGAATAITGAAGGVGGVFAPSLFMGSAAGFVVARVLKIAGIGFASELNFSLVGMAGVLSALLKAPLTSIFLIAEITGGYALLIPLIVTSGVAYVVGRFFCPYSIYAEDLANRRELVTHHKDRAALALMNPDSLIDSNFPVIPPDAPIPMLLSVALGSRKSTVAILDEEEHLLGTIRFDKVRNVLLARGELSDYRASDIAEPVKDIIPPGTNMSEVLALFEETNAEEIPCVRGDGKFVGFINRSRAFEAYRNQVMDLSEDKE